MRPLAALLLLICLPFPGWADRVALVIGNSKYTAVSELDNPQYDSAAVSAALRHQGFEVILADNLGRTELRDTLRRFRSLADRSEIALVYYAGHGIEIGGINYLVPVDARLEDERDAGLEMIEVDLVLGQISGARTLKMVILDACRNNPFIVRMQSSGSNRSVGQGLGDTRTTQSDTLIAYAAAAGEITPDGLAGENSPFTRAFLDALSGPPMDVRRMLGRVRDQMRLSVPGAAPFVYSSLGGGEYVINPRGLTPQAKPVPSQEPTAATSLGGASISQDFVRIDKNGTVQEWDDFLIRHEGQSSHPLYAFALEKRQALQNRAPAPTGNDRAGNQPIQAPQPPEPRPFKEVAKAFQSGLRARNCYRGAIDGILGRNSLGGWLRFGALAGETIRLSATSPVSDLEAAIELLDRHPGISCPVVSVSRKPKASSTAPTRRQARVAPAPAVQSKPNRQKKAGSTNFGRQDGTKLVPENVGDCIGTRAKFYDCN